ncbi:MAG TPA: cyclodeaminase/cyclohydrolase family protein [Planctomycetota bacterium]|nr:cyclodeaminase/cyclohydrolase family protein [Planctomycetota bacterium]
MKSIDSSVSTFLDELAARTPTPGGGSASALGGALGTALGSMAAGFTMGEKYKAVAPQITALIEQLGALRRRFTELIELDIDAYGGYSAARALPKETAEQKTARAQAIAAALEKSTAIPERIVDTAVEAFGVIEQLSSVANPNLAGDVAVAAYFLEAAARGAGIQVFSNCALNDTEGRNAARRAAIAMKLSLCQAARERIDQAVLKMMKIA